MVSEISLRGLTIEEVREWISEFDAPSPPEPEEVHRVTGGHPLAVELLEMYGSVMHGDWLRFLDEEILDVLPTEHREMLSYLAIAERPIEWEVLAKVCGLEGTPPTQLLSRGLIVELDDGLWLHEAMRERLLREVGDVIDERRATLDEALE